MKEDEPKPKNCETKHKFDSLKDAQGAKVYAEYLYGAKLKVYFCKDCGCWHLSSA
jgi:hypothetical protein